MLEKTDMKAKLGKGEFKAVKEKLSQELFLLEKEIKKAEIPVVVIIEGYGASGKGMIISELIAPLDPRSYKVFSTGAADSAQSRKPLLWRFWMDIPSRGKLAFLDRSWYQLTAAERFDGEIAQGELKRRYHSINILERQLSDDGYLVLKFFLQITKKEQKERFEKLQKDKNTAWLVNEKDKKRCLHFEEYSKYIDDMLENTSTQNAVWNVVPADDRRYAAAEVLKITVGALKKRLSGLEHTEKAKVTKEVVADSFMKTKFSGLDKIKPFIEMNDEEYKKELEKQQNKLSKLQNRLYLEKVPVVIAFEGWDAAGKGGAIRRVTDKMDPRGYEAVGVSAPDALSLSKHYLWRFWRELPKTGHVTLFDRTWYGRVLVERVEGFTSEKRWREGYQEINEFERELRENGVILIKFWLQIDKDEQLKRFEERQSNPEKQWKITDEDWRNREKWEQYEIAANEMISNTSTDFAPWNIIEGNNKKYARIKILKIINKTIEKSLNK